LLTHFINNFKSFYLGSGKGTGIAEVQVWVIAVRRTWGRLPPVWPLRLALIPIDLLLLLDQLFKLLGGK
jgi:hypothetical protein